MERDKRSPSDYEDRATSSWSKATIFLTILGMALLWVILEGAFSSIYPQNYKIDFENLSSNQHIVDYTSSNILFPGTYVTNYGSNFDVNGSSLFTYRKDIEVSSASLFDVVFVDILQVSTTAYTPLVIEGYRQGILIYSTSHYNLSYWTTVSLNYRRIDRLLFRVGDFDYNIDNIIINNSGPALIQIKVIEGY